MSAESVPVAVGPASHLQTHKPMRAPSRLLHHTRKLAGSSSTTGGPGRRLGELNLSSTTTSSSSSSSVSINNITDAWVKREWIGGVGAVAGKGVWQSSELSVNASEKQPVQFPPDLTVPQRPSFPPSFRVSLWQRSMRMRATPQTSCKGK